MVTRIYVVENKNDNTSRLIDATSSASALSHAAAGIFSARVAKAKDIAALMADGVQVESPAAGE